MKRLILTVIPLSLLALLTGCATPYMADRGRDAADIFTATVGVGLGTKARVSVVQTGIGANMDLAGLRGGEFHTDTSGGWFGFGSGEIEYLIGFYEDFEPSHASHAWDRHKTFNAQGRIIGGPTDGDWRTMLPYATQMEVAVSILGGFRLGFNPGELLDFVLGWTTIDIFADDLEWKRRKERNSIAMEPLS